MNVLGACCGEQQGKKENNLVTTRSGNYELKQSKQRQNIVSILMLTLMVLLGTVFSTASAQRANVKLELLTNSSRLLNGAGSSPLSIGDKVGLRVSSNCNCHIYIFNYDAVGVLSPLNNSANNYLQVGSVHTLPNNSERYEVQGPAGRESIFAIASLRPLNTARLQQLVNEQTQGYNTGARAVFNGGGTQQDGWLAASILFDVVNQSTTGYQTQAPVQQPSTVPANPATNQMPSTQAPVNTYTTPPVQNQIPATPYSTSNSKNCGLSIAAPSNSAGVSQRCVKKSFDSSFQNSAQMNDIIKYYGTALVGKGFDYQATTRNEARKFRANFAYQGKIYQMQVEKYESYYRFELLEYNQQAMNN